MRIRIKTFMYGAVCVTLAGQSLQLAASPAHAESCYKAAFIYYGTGDFASAEIGWSGDYYGALRAREKRIGDWERFEICGPENNSTIRSLANDRFVAAELGYPGRSYGMLRARTRRQDVGAWERFRISNHYVYSVANGATVSLTSGDGGTWDQVLRAGGGGDWPIRVVPTP